MQKEPIILSDYNSLALQTLFIIKIVCVSLGFLGSEYNSTWFLLHQGETGTKTLFFKTL